STGETDRLCNNSATSMIESTLCPLESGAGLDARVNLASNSLLPERARPFNRVRRFTKPHYTPRREDYYRFRGSLQSVIPRGAHSFNLVIPSGPRDDQRESRVVEGPCVFAVSNAGTNLHGIQREGFTQHSD